MRLRPQNMRSSLQARVPPCLLAFQPCQFRLFQSPRATWGDSIVEPQMHTDEQEQRGSIMIDRVQFLCNRFSALANPSNAKAMAAYMKTDMPFYGIKKPDRVPIVREMDRLFPIRTRAE